MGLRNARTTKGVQMTGQVFGGFRRRTRRLAANATLKVADSGATIFINAADLVVTLPPTAKGVYFTFVLESGGLSTGTGLQISPAAADFITGAGLTAVDNKDLILAGSGDRAGDSVSLEGDGVNGWYIRAHEGTYTKQA